jgi:catechol 2,3-dioxygenase-like lactoylglutathione lyase family enzyme
MIGTLRTVVMDCKRPRDLADFWRDVLGGTISADDDDDTWVVLIDSDGRRLAFQQAPEHKPPTFPDPRGSQQFHLDITVTDIEEAEAKVLALGATRVTEDHGEDDFRVYRDPAGHTFCLVWSALPQPMP